MMLKIPYKEVKILNEVLYIITFITIIFCINM